MSHPRPLRALALLARCAPRRLALASFAAYAAMSVGTTDLSAQEPPGADYEQRVVVERRRIVLGERIYFEHGRGRILPVSFRILEALAKKLRDRPAIERVQIEGHTDTSGPAEVNQRLSAFRARAVRDYLIQKGVDASRLVARGFGEDWPIATNADDAGRERNRRVDFVILEVLKRNVWRRRPATQDYVVAIRAAGGAEERGPEGAAVALKADQPLYAGDTVDTPGNATAVLRLPGLALIHVGARSALRIERVVGAAEGEGREVGLRLVRGAVRIRALRPRAQGGPLVNLKVGGATVSLDDGECRVTREAGGARVEVLAGAARVVASDGEHALSSGDGLRVDTIAGSAVNHQLPRAPGSRKQEAGAAEATRLTWAKVAGAMAYLVELARDVDFLDVVARHEVAAEKLELSLPAGAYHWRVHARDTAGFEGAPWPQLTFDKK